MASPQLENGYLRIANEIIDAMVRYRVPGEQMQCLLFIIRKTYGFGKKEDRIALSQFVKATGLSKQSAYRAVTKLVQKKVVIKKVYGRAITYGFNKKYWEWDSSTKRLTHSPMSSVRKHCYVCGFEAVVEKHHITPKGEGGSDRVENLIMLCPNCHALVHKGKIKEDLSSLKLTVEKVDKKVHLLSSKKMNTKDTTTKDNSNTNSRTKKFIKPTLEEVTAYCLQRKNSIDPQLWYDHYTSNDWKVGKNKMKDWQAAVRTWERRKKNNSKPVNSNSMKQDFNEAMAKALNEEAEYETSVRNSSQDVGQIEHKI